MLTKKQKDLLIFIHEEMSESDIAPSFEEMKNKLGLKSKSGIHRLITGLVERGYLERLPHRARALEVKKLPESYTKQNPQNAAANNLVTGNATSFSLDIIPMHGKIAAGTPIEALEHSGETLQVPAGFSGRGEHYGLTVDGDSMIDIGIHDGDTVIIERCETACNNDIVVALVDGFEVTLKRFEKKDATIILHPENENHAPQVLSADRVRIQGKLLSLMRQYH